MVFVTMVVTIKVIVVRDGCTVSCFRDYGGDVKGDCGEIRLHSKWFW